MVLTRRSSFAGRAPSKAALYGPASKLGEVLTLHNCTGMPAHRRRPPKRSTHLSCDVAVAREASAETVTAGLELECQLYRDKLKVSSFPTTLCPAAYPHHGDGVCVCVCVTQKTDGAAQVA